METGAETGAIDIRECPTWPNCRCGACSLCGHQKHKAIHGPVHGEPPGSKPWGHEYIQKEHQSDATTS